MTFELVDTSYYLCGRAQNNKNTFATKTLINGYRTIEAERR